MDCPIKTSIASMHSWHANRMWEDIPQFEKSRYSPIAEFRSVKHNAEDAIAELLEILPQGDVRCGMAIQLAGWLLNEIKELPDNLLIVDDDE